VLQTGGPDGKAISGIDTKNGKTLWSLGDGKIEYQSPTLMEIAGGNQVVAIAGKTIQGIDSADGEVLWKHELGEDDRVESANPTRAGRNRILLFASGSAAVIEVARKAGAYETKELYRSKDLGNTYALPVYHDGHLYGFRRQFLTCVDAETGKAVWKSRPPGGRGLILVDDRLVVFGSGGNVVVVEATHEGYRETTRLQALDGSGYTWPSFAEGRIYVRNLEKLASVSIVEATTASTDPASTVAIAHTEFGKFVQRVEEASDKDRLIEEFVKANEHSPVIEGNYVHFFYLGDVEDIAISGSMIASGNPEPMERIEGTELHYRSYKLEPAGRWEYEYNLNFEERVVDPRNSRTVPAQFGERSLSVAMMPGYETADYLAEPEGERRGTMEAFTYKSEMLGNEREIQVYLPYGYQDGDRSFPLLIVHQGEDWLDKGKMANSLDNLIGERVAPVVVAFVPPRGEWWLEAGGSGTDDFVDMLADELVPFLDERYRLIEDASSRALMGTGYFGVTAAYGALRNADVFGNAALQSVALGLGSDDALMEAIGRGRGDEVRFYLDWSRYETRRVDQGVDLGEDNRSLARALEEGGFGFVGGEVLDSYGWGGWPNRTGEILVTFFPAD
jgi:enterochelin esterase family protein